MQEAIISRAFFNPILLLREKVYGCEAFPYSSNKYDFIAPNTSANSYKCSIWVEKDGRRVNAKSLLGVLSLGITKDSVITLVADGDDEVEALNGLEELIESGLTD